MFFLLCHTLTKVECEMIHAFAYSKLEEWNSVNGQMGFWVHRNIVNAQTWLPWLRTNFGDIGVGGHISEL